jgi:hypothetical protein
LLVFIGIFIVKALETQNRYAFPPFIFIPKGTYLPSDTLSSRVRQGGWSDGWLAGMILMGESRNETILKLKNNLPAFANPSKPKPVIMTGSESDGNSNPSGSGNRAFRPNQDAPANIPAVIIRNSKVSLAYRINKQMYLWVSDPKINLGQMIKLFLRRFQSLI